MKKIIYSLMGITALAFALSCEKEQELPKEEAKTVAENENPEVLPTNIPAAITASLVDTKTSYDGTGAFSWTTGEDGDHIYLMFYKEDTHYQGWVEYKATSADANGKAVFTIVSNQGDRISALADYTNSGVAVYGAVSDNHVARPYSANAEACTLYKPDGEHTVTYDPFLTLQNSLAGASSEVILLGTGVGDTDSNTGVFTDYHFYTACAVLKVTVSGIPNNAKELRLCTADKVNYPLDGDFAITYIRAAEKPIAPELTKDSYRQYESSGNYWDSSHSYVAAAWDGSSTTQTFYFNVPTGEYPANTLSLKLVDTGGNALLEKTITAAYTFNRNDLVPASFANEWVTLGTGKFFDKFPNNNFKNNVYAGVTIQRNVANTNKYRVVNPYGLFETTAVDPAPYLTFTVDTSNGLVDFDDTDTGITIDSSHKIIIKHPSKGGPKGGDTSDLSHNKVVTGINTSPSVVQLAPVYWYSDADNGYRRNTTDNNLIIIFPGYDTDAEYDCSGLATASDLTFTVTGTNVATAKIGVHQYSNDALTNMNNCEAFTGSTGKLVTSAKGTATGTYGRYIAYRIYNSDGAEIGFHKPTEIVTLHSISSTDATAVAGTYYIANSSSYPIVISTSDKCLMGNMKIIEYNASGWDLKGNIYIKYTSSTMTLDDQQVFDIKSSKYYGIHNGSTGEPTGSLSFSVSESSGKKTFSRNGFGFGIATVSDGKATYYTATSHKWTNGTCSIVQQ